MLKITEPVGLLAQMRLPPPSPMAKLARSMRWDSATTTATLHAIRSLQASWRAALDERRRLRATFTLQCYARLRRSRPRPRPLPFVAALEGQIRCLAALSVASLIVLDGTLGIIRPPHGRVATAFCSLPALRALLAELWRTQSGTQDRSNLLDAIALSSTLQAVAIAVRSLIDTDSLKSEALLTQEFTSLRCLHIAVVLGAMPCSERARILYFWQMSTAILLVTIVHASLLGGHIGWMLLRGLGVFVLAHRATCKMTRSAMRHTHEREMAMAELTVAIDGTRGSSSLMALVDTESVQREWREGPLSRYCAQAFMATITLFLTGRGLLMYFDEGRNMATSFLVTRSSLVYPMGAVVAGAYVPFARSNRAIHIAMCAIGALMLVVNSMQVAVGVKGLVQLLCRRTKPALFGGVDLDLDYFYELEQHFVQCTASAVSHPVKVESSLHASQGAPGIEGLVQLHESAMAFLRGLCAALVPLSPRTRLLVVGITILKQLINTADRALSANGFQVAMGLLTRETSLLMLGSAAGYIGVEGAIASIWKRQRLLAKLEVNRRSQLQVKARVFLRKAIADEDDAAAQRREHVAAPVTQGLTDSVFDAPTAHRRIAFSFLCSPVHAQRHGASIPPTTSRLNGRGAQATNPCKRILTADARAPEAPTKGLHMRTAEKTFSHNSPKSSSPVCSTHNGSNSAQASSGTAPPHSNKIR